MSHYNKCVCDTSLGLESFRNQSENLDWELILYRKRAKMKIVWEINIYSSRSKQQVSSFLRIDTWVWFQQRPFEFRSSVLKVGYKTSGRHFIVRFERNVCRADFNWRWLLNRSDFIIFGYFQASKSEKSESKMQSNAGKQTNKEKKATKE